MLYKKLIGIFIALSLILATGVGGYIIIEGWQPLDALYMTVITLASVGFMEVHPLSSPGRVFTIVLILCGSGALIYGVSVITAFIVEGELTDIIRRNKMLKKIKGLNRHYMVCGAGQTGRYVVDELLKTKKDFVVIEKDHEKARSLIEQNIPCMEGDATHDAILISAGIQKAKGFITCLHSDAENLFVVITAKRLNPSLRVISKAVEEESEMKIRMVGADGVVMPNFIGGLRMASEMIRPSVVNFLDTMLRSKDQTIRIEEIGLGNGSPYIGMRLQETGLQAVEGVTIVALKDKDLPTYTFNPSGATVLKENTMIVAMGNVDLISEMEARTNPQAE